MFRATCPKLSIVRRTGNDDSPALPESGGQHAPHASASPNSSRKLARASQADRARRAGSREMGTCRYSERRKEIAKSSRRLVQKEFAEDSCCPVRAGLVCANRSRNRIFRR